MATTKKALLEENERLKPLNKQLLQTCRMGRWIIREEELTGSFVEAFEAGLKDAEQQGKGE